MAIPILILNGAPGTGKDMIAQYIKDTYGWDHMEFKHHLYIETAKELGLELHWFMKLATDPELKDTVKMHTYAGRMTPREALIFTSEELIKPYRGKDYFGCRLAKDILATKKSKGFVISDGGFEEELTALKSLEHQGYKVWVVRLTREGCTFENDSRTYFNQVDYTLHNVNKAQVYWDTDDIIASVLYNNEE